MNTAETIHKTKNDCDMFPCVVRQSYWDIIQYIGYNIMQAQKVEYSSYG